MPITPIEMITMAPKSQEASQYKQNEVQKSFSEQVQLTNEFSKEVQHNSQQAVKTVKSENNKYRYDAKEKGNNSYSSQNKNKKQEKQERIERIDSEEHEIKLSNFDIKI